jgi:hypothetical protein
VTGGGGLVRALGRGILVGPLARHAGKAAGGSW